MAIDQVAEALRLKLAREAYDAGRLRLAGPDLRGFSHLVTSRQGLFAVRQGEVQLVAHGLFFGMVTTPDAVFVFESGDLARNHGNFGRIVRLDLAEGQVSGWSIVAQGLSSGCHQLDLIDGRLCIADTYNQCLRWFDPGGAGEGEYRPLPAAPAHDWGAGYVHVNSLLAVRDAVLLVLHNGGKATGSPSELAVLDREWRLQERIELPGRGCHNLALRPDGTVLTCASLTGEIAELGGRRVKVSEMMTRGLSLDEGGLVVGASEFSNRLQRHEARGCVVFLDSEMQVLESLDLAGAPTEIRRINGRDFGQSAMTGGITARLA